MGVEQRLAEYLNSETMWSQPQYWLSSLPILWQAIE